MEIFAAQRAERERFMQQHRAKTGDTGNENAAPPPYETGGSPKESVEPTPLPKAHV
jgi:hypothetical protein